MSLGQASSTASRLLLRQRLPYSRRAGLQHCTAPTVRRSLQPTTIIRSASSDDSPIGDVVVDQTRKQPSDPTSPSKEGGDRFARTTSESQIQRDKAVPTAPQDSKDSASRGGANALSGSQHPAKQPDPQVPPSRSTGFESEGPDGRAGEGKEPEHGTKEKGAGPFMRQ